MEIFYLSLFLIFFSSKRKVSIFSLSSLALTVVAGFSSSDLFQFTNGCEGKKKVKRVESGKMEKRIFKKLTLSSDHLDDPPAPPILDGILIEFFLSTFVAFEKKLFRVSSCSLL